jgi:hypothetical protein
LLDEYKNSIYTIVMDTSNKNLNRRHGGKMNEMVESVAKAICEGEGFEWRPEERHVLWERLARAAIRAMREPTPEMLSSGWSDLYDAEDRRASWRNMIDQLLNE